MQTMMKKATTMQTMKKTTTMKLFHGAALSGLLLTGVSFVGASPARAQLELPEASPAAKVMQRVGLTDIEVEYASPGVKGRKIWGGLVPYGKVWRSGANAATTITFSHDVKIGGKPVPAGSYAVLTLPTQKGWTLILNKELGLFRGKSYDKKLDVVRVPATTAAIPHRERLAYLFSNTTDNSTTLDLEWEKLKISVPIVVDTDKHTEASIATNVDGAWRAHANAARYLLETKKDTARALRYVDTSIAMQSTWFNQWIRARILAEKGDIKEARKAAQIAYDLGKKDKGFFYKDAVEKALAEWK